MNEDGTEIIRSILSVAPLLLKKEDDEKEGEEGQVWMEVDVSHPFLFEEEEKLNQATEMGKGEKMHLVEWREDMSGKPRFICWGRKGRGKD